VTRQTPASRAGEGRGGEVKLNGDCPRTVLGIKVALKVVM